MPRMQARTHESDHAGVAHCDPPKRCPGCGRLFELWPENSAVCLGCRVHPPRERQYLAEFPPPESFGIVMRDHVTGSDREAILRPSRRKRINLSSKPKDQATIDTRRETEINEETPDYAKR